MNIFFAVPPDMEAEAGRAGIELAHMAYRQEGGHLCRAEAVPAYTRGGVMVCDAAGLRPGDGARTLARGILAECAARGYTGVVL
ncbi:MAG: hypothetical protein LBC21_02955, partial [Oscillospiraceae bacterium]|nr:hypothetical protein [Oscillospiraceae bacterium]